MSNNQVISTSTAITSILFSEEPGESQESTIALVIYWFRNVFICLKCITFIYKSIWTASRYHKTNKSCCQFEIWFLIIASIKIAVLLPNIYWKDINYIYACFLMDSILIFWLSHTLQIRSCVILKRSKCAVMSYKVWFGFRLFLVFSSWVYAPFFDVRDDWDKDYMFIMTCTPVLYPYRFLAIFAINFISASVDLMLMLFDPTYFNARERLKFARQQIIMQSDSQRAKTGTNHFSEGLGD